MRMIRVGMRIGAGMLALGLGLLAIPAGLDAQRPAGSARIKYGGVPATRLGRPFRGQLPSSPRRHTGQRPHGKK
jgi:hypothetical protein